MRVLLTDGSGLTARQVATELSLAGHRVEVLTPDPLALTRFTRHVAKLHKVPPYGADPFAWLDAALDVYRGGGFDVLFPTQEQVAVLAATQPPVVTAVPTFEALSRVQDKISAYSTLASLGIPQPPSVVVYQESDLAEWDSFPAYSKPPIGTATSGIRQVRGRSELAWEGKPFLLQERVDGPLVMAQTVFDHGRRSPVRPTCESGKGRAAGPATSAAWTFRQCVNTSGGSGLICCGMARSSADVILGADGPFFIDINPRLVEPGNARRAGVDMVDALLATALGREPVAQPLGRIDVATHQLLLAVLGAAQSGRARRGVLRELRDAARHRASYEGSVEELTPVRHDLRAAVPVTAAALATLAWPRSWRFFSAGAVANYALSPDGWEAIVETQSMRE